MRHLNPMILITSFLLTFACSSCNQAERSGNKENVLTEKEQAQGKDSVKPAIDSQVTKIPAPVSSVPGDLDFLRNLNGKYPYDVKLLDNPELKKRLTSLLGNRFGFMKTTWAVEEPIEIKNNIFVATGCEAHNCGSTNFIIAVDLAKNIVYAGVRENDQVKTYSENGSSIQQVNDWATEK